MTVKEQLMLLTKGYTKSEIDAMKEAEKLENQPPKDDPPKDDPPKDDPPKDDPPKDDPPKDDPRDNKIKEMEEEIKRLQSENAHRDISGGDKDTLTDFEKGVEIFRGKF